MSDLEMCFNCDQPTGKAGAMEDSQMIEGKPYCEDCYDECVIEKIDYYANEIRELKAQLDRVNKRALFTEALALELDVTVDDLLSMPQISGAIKAITQEVRG